MRSGTLQYLHVSEFGKICAKFPDKAKEVLTGSIPAVSLVVLLLLNQRLRWGWCILRDVRDSPKNKRSNKESYLERLQVPLLSWFGATEYALDPYGIVITEKDHAYFDSIEQECGVTLSIEQRAWWCATRDTDFSGESQLMWQEYPSTPKEAFKSLKKAAGIQSNSPAFAKKGVSARFRTVREFQLILFGILEILTEQRFGFISVLVCKIYLLALMKVGVSLTPTL